MMVGDLLLMVVVDLLLHYGEAGTHPHLEVLMSRVLRLMAGLVATKYKTKCRTLLFIFHVHFKSKSFSILVLSQ
mgnify:FL=1